MTGKIGDFDDDHLSVIALSHDRLVAYVEQCDAVIHALHMAAHAQKAAAEAELRACHEENRRLQLVVAMCREKTKGKPPK